MLLQLSIQNYATVDRLEIDFKSGMSCITGETGAGKSIILGALGLTLGDRADKTVVRTGKGKADICAEFDTNTIALAKTWLEKRDLLSESTSTCILRRVVNNDGRSKGYINGTAVTMKNLRDLGEMLIDIHNQHEHQSLLQKSTHQRLLDDFCLDKSLRGKLSSTWKQWHQNFRELESLKVRSEEDSAEIQLLSYQLSELEDLAIEENEFEKLENEFKELSDAEEIILASTQALSVCESESDQGVITLISSAMRSLQGIKTKPNEIQSVISTLETARIQLDEAVSDLRSFHEKFDANPQRLNELNLRLGELHSISRKHNAKPHELLEIVETLRSKLNRFKNSGDELDKLAANDKLLREQYMLISAQVTEKRREGSRELAKSINNQLSKLSMQHAELKICFKNRNDENPTEGGRESIEFLVSTNPGAKAESLAKIASGGELSRISLAIQVIAAQTSQIPSLVFDEVDVGIGGGVAKLIGSLLRTLGEKAQILCVTHQAQVASQGHHHFLVRKESSQNSTLTQIEELSRDAVITEIARMLGGENFSEESRAHAEQMVISN